MSAQSRPRRFGWTEKRVHDHIRKHKLAERHPGVDEEILHVIAAEEIVIKQLARVGIPYTGRSVLA